MINKAIILAAGRGSRMGDATKSTPKGLFELFGKPLICHQIASFQQAGIQDITVVTGYQASQFDFLNLPTIHNHNWASTNMVSSLICADSILSAEPCLISYADIFFTSSIVKEMSQNTLNCNVSYDPNWLSLWQGRFEDPLSDAETFKISEQNQLLEIGKHPSSVEEIEGQYMGLLGFTPSFWKAVMEFTSQLSELERSKLDMTSLLQHMIEKGHQITSTPNTDVWGEVDNLTDAEFYKNNPALKSAFL